MNFLLRGFGKETWEYSPTYAIRSWAYLLPLAIPLYPITKIIDYYKFQPQISFYLIRIIIGSFTLYSELHLFTTLQNYIDTQISWLYLIFTTLSPGMSHASIAFLPSSFAMNCTTLATSNLIKYFHGKSIRNAILVTLWFSIGGIFGWPFVLILAVFSTIIIFAQNFLNVRKFKRYIGWSFLIFLINIAISMEIDSNFYSKTVLVPLNIVLYNVIFANENSGPNIFGVEPLSYYIKNLILNFHFIAPLAYIGVFLLPIIMFISPKKNMYKISSLEMFTILSPIIIWSGVFFSQPHKEERFLYPIYSTILLSASFTIHYLLNFSTQIISKFKSFKKIGNLINILGILTIILLHQILSISRILSLSTNYIAPLQVYNKLPTNATGNLCVGREWYRYPSSFFLSKNLRLRFIKSNFDGLLPGDFNENLSKFDSISSIPLNMNNLNQFDSSKIFDFNNCDYAIDITQSVDIEGNEIEFIDNKGNIKQGWELISSYPFLNNEESKGIGRILYIPSVLNEIFKTKLVYHQYNLYGKKKEE